MLCGKWIVLQVAVHAERRVHWALLNKGYECFLPLYVVTSTARNARRIVEAPMFPGYVLCRQNTQPSGFVVTTPGVRKIVSFAGKPATLEDHEIVAIQQVTGSGQKCGPHPYLRVGETVMIVSGPLQGVRGFLVRGGNKRRLIISVDVLTRSIFVEADSCDIVALSSVSVGGKMFTAA